MGRCAMMVGSSSRTADDTTSITFERPDPGRVREEAELEVVAGHDIGRRFPLGEEVVLGRGEGVDIAMDDDRVSRLHARIRRTSPRSWVLEDLGSRNHTYVNGAQITSSALQFGDRITLGFGTALRFRRRDSAEERELQAQKLQSLGKLASGIAHDFNNLLVVILANVTELRAPEQHDPAAVADALSEIEIAARRAVDLTSQLLTFARSRRREHHPYDLSKLVDEQARMLARTLHRSITLDVDVPDDLTAVGDPSQIHQVLMNLCVNGADAMPSGGTLSIRGSAEEIRDDNRFDPPLPAGRYVVLEIEDTGTGMSEEIRERLFEPFFTTKGPGRGTGLGLPTALSAVRHNGGRVEVSSTPGVGTCFRVILPGARRTAGRYESTQLGWSQTLHGRALLVDDDDLVRRVLARVLQRGGMEVLQANDGDEAIEVFVRHGADVDVVVLDLDMPRLGGEETLDALRTMRPDVPVLISSGHYDEDRDRALRASGVRGVLHKPYDAATLLKAVTEAMRPTGESA